METTLQLPNRVLRRGIGKIGRLIGPAQPNKDNALQIFCGGSKQIVSKVPLNGTTLPLPNSITLAQSDALLARQVGNASRQVEIETRKVAKLCWKPGRVHVMKFWGAAKAILTDRYVLLAQTKTVDCTTYCGNSSNTWINTTNSSLSSLADVCGFLVVINLHGHLWHLTWLSAAWPKEMPDALKSNISWIQRRTWTIHRNANSWLGQSCKTRLFFQRHFFGKQLSMTWCSLNIWC